MRLATGDEDHLAQCVALVVAEVERREYERLKHLAREISKQFRGSGVDAHASAGRVTFSVDDAVKLLELVREQ